VLESLRPILTGTVGPPGHVLIAWATSGISGRFIEEDRPKRTGSKLNKVSYTDLLLVCEASKVAAQSLQSNVLRVGAFVGEDERAITGTVEAIVKRGTDGSTSGIRAFTIAKELCRKSGGDLVPHGWASALTIGELVDDTGYESAQRTLGLRSRCLHVGELESLGGARSSQDGDEGC